jgi:hypothetical protein
MAEFWKRSQDRNSRIEQKKKLPEPKVKLPSIRLDFHPISSTSKAIPGISKELHRNSYPYFFTSCQSANEA